MKRQLVFPVSTMSQWWVRRSSMVVAVYAASALFSPLLAIPLFTAVSLAYAAPTFFNAGKWRSG